MLVFENDLDRTDRFIVTRTFPFHLFEIPSLVREFNILQRLILLAPHLFQPQKVLYLNENGIQKFSALLADVLYKNTYQKKLEILNTSQLESLSFIHPNIRKGIYFQEYKLNVSRLFIELLKYFHSEGGTVKVNCPVKVEYNTLTFPETRETAVVKKSTICEDQKTVNYLIPLKNPYGFSMVYRNSTLAFRFLQHRKMWIARPINQASEQLSAQKFLEFIQTLFLPKIEKAGKTESTKNPSSEILKELANQIPHSLDCSFKQTDLKDMHERCLEKFDLAKQTGISYAGFKTVFNRYGAGIDEMTEEAYGFMNEFRDPAKIWDITEKNYQKKNEWGI